MFDSLGDDDGPVQTFTLDTPTSSAPTSTAVGASETQDIFSQESEAEQELAAAKALSKSCEVLQNITQLVLDARVTFFYREVAAQPAPLEIVDKIPESALWMRSGGVGRSSIGSFTQLTPRGEDWFRNIFTSLQVGGSDTLEAKTFNDHLFMLLMERNHEVCDNALSYLRSYYGALSGQ